MTILISALTFQDERRVTVLASEIVAAAEGDRDHRLRHNTYITLRNGAEYRLLVDIDAVTSAMTSAGVEADMVPKVTAPSEGVPSHVFTHPHAGSNCRCLKLCSICHKQQNHPNHVGPPSTGYSRVERDLRSDYDLPDAPDHRMDDPV